MNPAALIHHMQRELDALRKEADDRRAQLERAHREVGALKYETELKLALFRERVFGRLRDLARTWADEADSGGDDATRDTWQHCADELAQVLLEVFEVKEEKS